MTPDSTDPKAVADANCIAWAKRDRLLDEVVFDPTIHYCPETDEKAVTDFRYRRLNEPPVSKNWFHTRINYLSFRRFDGRQVRTAITGTVRTVDGRPVVDVVLNRLNSNQVGDTIRFLVVHFMSHCYATNPNAFPRRTTGRGYGNCWKKFVNSISKLLPCLFFLVLLSFSNWSDCLFFLFNRCVDTETALWTRRRTPSTSRTWLDIIPSHKDCCLNDETWDHINIAASMAAAPYADSSTIAALQLIPQRVYTETLTFRQLSDSDHHHPPVSPTFFEVRSTLI